MSFGIGNLGMLLGLLALAIPVLIHLLQRRRFDIVDWGAMQFLHVAPSTRRRWWWDEFILLLLRMGMLAVLVLALASPFVEGKLVQQFSGSSRRTVVFILDPSASMSRGDVWTRAKDWITNALDQLQGSDRAMVLLAGTTVTKLTPEPTSDLSGLRELVKRLPEPDSASDLPGAVEAAQEALAQSPFEGEAFLCIVRDDQQSGWTDPQTMERWESVARALRVGQFGAKPAIVDLSRDEARKANVWLGPLQSDRLVLAPGQKVAVQSRLHWQGSVEGKEATLIASLNGRESKRWTVPLAGERNPVPIDFVLPVPEAGSQLVSIAVRVDSASDAIQQDNIQHLVIESVQGLPILLVEGDESVSPKGSTHFLRNALGGRGNAEDLFEVRVVTASKLSADLLFDGDRNHVRVVVLSDLPGINDAQSKAIERFLRQGGSAFVSLGPRAMKHVAEYRDVHAEGVGWLPFKVVEAEGTEKGKLENAARILAMGPPHPVLDYFRDPSRGLGEARFSRWAKGSVAEGATSISFLDAGQPFLIESRYGSGRVLVSTVPLDRSWDSDFPSLHAYPVFMHRVLLYLAEAGNKGQRLLPGQSVDWQPPQNDLVPLPATLYWQESDGEARAFIAQHWPCVTPPARRTGPVRLSWGVGKGVWFVVPLPPSESDLSSSSNAERETLERLLGLRTISDPVEAMASGTGEQPSSVEVWWVLLLFVVLFLLMEIWFTRRIAMQRGMV